MPRAPHIAKCALCGARGRRAVAQARLEAATLPPTFVGLFCSWTRPILTEDRPRLEDVASGYWTLSVKQSSGLVSHYGSSPSSSARPLDESSSCYNDDV